MYEHKTKAHAESFTAKYNVNKFVWYIVGDDITSTIALEKKIKNRNKAWKLALIEKKPRVERSEFRFYGFRDCARNDGGN